MRRSRPSEAAPRHSLERKRFSSSKPGARPTDQSLQRDSRNPCRLLLRVYGQPCGHHLPLPQAGQGDAERVVPQARGSLLAGPAGRDCPIFVPRAAKGGGGGRVLISPRSRSRRGTRRQGRGQTAGDASEADGQRQNGDKQRLKLPRL